MNDLLVFAGHNTLVALVFALFVYGLTRRQRNPPLSHVLWILVLLKLVAPPVMCFDWSALRQSGSTAMRGQITADTVRTARPQTVNPSRPVDWPPARTTTLASATNVTEFDFPASVHLIWNRGRVILLWFWLGGAGLCALVAATRIVRFERLLQDKLPVSERLQRIAHEVADKLGVRRVPAVRCVECALVPLIWCAGRRATIVLPLRLMRQVDDQSSALILAHELAHLRRRDHWVRGLELIVLTVYWWNPLVWLILRQIHQAEDLCCDGWVRSVFPEFTKRYAEVVLKTAESLNARQVGAQWLPASPFLQSLSLKIRNCKPHLSAFHERYVPPKLFAERIGQQCGLRE
jgi:beta-lactamase regulating signal transducer with metallopeptidase domain